jgi:tetratricopeptide (TPR) repeat protein
MMRRFLLASVLAAVFSVVVALPGAFCQEQQSSFSLHLSPVMDVPLGDSLTYYRFVGGGAFSAEYRLPFFPLLFIDGGLGYTFYSIRNSDVAEQSLSIISASIGLGLQLDLLPTLGVKAYFNGGYGYGFSNDFTPFLSGGGSFLETGARLSWSVKPGFSLGLGLSYRYEFGLFQGLAMAIDTGFPLGGAARKGGAETLPEKAQPLQESGKGLNLNDLQFPNIFPVFHKYYDDHPVGTATLYNAESDPVSDIKVSLEIKPYMTAPKQCTVQTELAPGESAPVEMFALFSEESILAVTEGTKASAEISWEYMMNGRKQTGKTVATVRILNRNAMTWEDDRRAAAFVTALDPAVLSFSRNVSSMAKSIVGGAVNPKMLSAMALYVALCQYGMTYAVDPKSSYTDFSQNRAETDFLQFPQQTLQYKAGDCDDLSILYCALFESLSIDTAFITVPGHIFMAFSLGISTDEARQIFQNSDDVIDRNGTAWIPFEVTALDGKFLEAWQAGAKEWRAGDAGGTGNFYPLHDAWQIYEPVGLVGGAAAVTVPPKDAFVAALQKEMQRFVEREIYPEITRLQAEITASRNNWSAMNKLGVLYAKYGLLTQAEKQFKDVLAKTEYPPALMNLGNVAYLQKDLRAAAGFYERAYAKTPDDAKVVACLARVYHEMESYAKAQELSDRLKELDPELAQKFAYLDLQGGQSARAADTTEETMLWGEE